MYMYSLDVVTVHLNFVKYPVLFLETVYEWGAGTSSLNEPRQILADVPVIGISAGIKCEFVNLSVNG